MPLTRVYREGVLVAEGFPVTEVSEHLRDETAVVWFDLCAPTADELGTIREELGLHNLAVEGALSDDQRPKLVRFEHHLFLTAYGVRLNPDTGVVHTDEVAAFATKRALVTVRKSEHFPIDEVIARWDGSPDLAKYGVSFLLHGLLDFVVDTHFVAAFALDEALDGLEDAIFDEHPRDQSVQRSIFQLRRSLVTLRRVVLPMREVINSVLRRDLHVLADEMMPYYQDVYDHVLRATEWTESLRDLLTTILDTQLTVRGNRLNVIMKQVTSWAAIIAVPTAVTGFYGMNVPYPGFGDQSGYIASLVILIAMSVALYVYFRRKDWL